MSIDERFSSASFEKIGEDSAAARRVTDELEAEMRRLLQPVVSARLATLIDELNKEGHQLRCESDEPGDISFIDSRTGLVIGFDYPVGVGYPEYDTHLVTDIED